MEYNKNKFVKANDHKVLHKVKKQWVVLSMSMLALLGGGVVAKHVSAHAAAANNNQGQPALKDRLNQNLSQTRQQPTLVQSPAEAQSARNNTYNGHQLSNNGQIHSTSQNITNQANVLHNRILRNANEQAVNVSKNEASQRRSNVGIYSKALTNAPSNALAGPSPLSSSKTVNETIKFNYVDGNPNNDQTSDTEKGTPGTQGTVSVPRPGNYVFSDTETSRQFTYSDNVNNQTITMNVYKPDIIDFVLSGNNIPHNYKGPVGVISSDDQDYYNQHSEHSDSYTFSDNASSVNGLPVNYHIAGPQSINYDGFTHRIQIAPNKEQGYINYVYTDRKGNQHLVKQVSLAKTPSDSYGVQFHVNGKSGISDEMSTGITGVSSSDKINGTGNYNGKQYRLVNQGANDNKFVFDDGTLLNGKPQGDSSEQDNPSDTTKAYNPSNNVFTVPVEPVKGSEIDIYYINETGQQIGSTRKFNSDYGTSLNTINTSGPNKGKLSDKIVSDNPDSTDYKVDLTGEQLNQIYSTYHFASDVQDVTVPLVGNNTNNQNNSKNQIKINIRRVNSDGTATQPATVTLNGQIGNFVTLKPSDLLRSSGKLWDEQGNQIGMFTSNVPNNELNNYVVDPNYPDTKHGDANAKNDWNTKPVTYYLKGNGDGTATLYDTISDASMIDKKTGSQTNGDQIKPHYVPTNGTTTWPTFTYINHKPGTIKLTYKDTSGNTVRGDLGNSDNIVPSASDYGKSINLISSDSKLSSGSKGEKVPNGYALADTNMPNTIYTINGNDQNVTLYVKKIDNQEMTTNTSSKYPLIINRVEHVFINGTSKGTKLASPSYPKISNVVGKSDTLNAPKYVPNDGNNIVDVASDASYKFIFNNNGTLTVTDYKNGKGSDVSPTNLNPNDKLTSTNGVDGTKEIVFNYNDFETVPHKHNYVHYISYSDMDNYSDITKTFNDKKFLTTLSDTGSDNHHFNSKPYDTINVPQGYQFYKIWKVQSDNDGGNPYVNSRDVDNDPHDSGYTANNSDFKNHRFDHPLTRFGKNDQDEYIEVIPNASQITVHYVDQNGHQLSQNTYSGSDKSQIDKRGYSSKYGQFIQESDIENNVPKGYQLEVQPYHTADNSIDHNSIFMFGRQPQDVKVTVVGQSAQLITVKYINQAGDLVGYQSFAGRLGDSVNVVGNEKQNVPRGYQLADDTQPTTYGFEKNPYTVYLNVKGQSVTHNLIIEKVMKQSDGTTKVSDGPSVKLSGSDGSVTEVNPGTYTPNGYTPDYSKDSVQFITLNQNPKLMPNKVVFYYNDRTTNGAPITIRYVNQTGDQVGSQILNGNVGKQTANASDLFNSQTSLKNTYSIDEVKNNGAATKFTFSNSPQTKTIYLKGNNNSTQFDLKIITENADGSKAKVSDNKIPVGNQVGDHFDISPYDHIPSGGFHPTESDSDISGTVEANGQLSPVNSAAFIYQNDSGQANEGIGTVRVHYVTKDLNSDGGINNGTGKPNDNDEIDEESDQGYVNQDTFDATPYLHDIPESVSQFYDIPSGEQALDSNNHSISNDSWKFQSGVHDIYVKVDRTNGPIIID